MYHIVIGDELYVYFKGKLIYKRWLALGYGKIFHSGESTTQHV